MKLEAEESVNYGDDSEVLPEVLQAACHHLARVQQLFELREKQIGRVSQA